MLYNMAVPNITHEVSSVKVLKNDNHFGEVWPAEASTNAAKAPYWSQEGDKPRSLHNWVRTAFIRQPFGRRIGRGNQLPFR